MHPEIGMAEAGQQLLDRFGVTFSGIRIDLRGTTALGPLDDAQDRIPNADIPADPVELGPGGCTLEIDIRAEAHLVARATGGAFQGGKAGKIDEGDDGRPLVCKDMAGSMDKARVAFRRGTQIAGEPGADLGPARFGEGVGAHACTGGGDRQRAGGFIEAAGQAGDRRVLEQAHEAVLRLPNGIGQVERGVA